MKLPIIFKLQGMTSRLSERCVKHLKIKPVRSLIRNYPLLHRIIAVGTNESVNVSAKTVSKFGRCRVSFKRFSQSEPGRPVIIIIILIKIKFFK